MHKPELKNWMRDATAQKFWRLIAPRHVEDAGAALAAAYDEPHRAYHAFGHIADLLRKLDRFQGCAVRPDLIAAAVFWHDSVYVTREDDGRARPDAENVRASAALFRAHSRFSPLETDAVEDMILSTAHHAAARPRREFYPGYGLDHDLFIDLDLSPLAAPWPDFLQNLEDIRQEYAWVPPDAFSEGRLAMLETFTNGGGPLYRRAETRALWERSARDNMAKVIEELRGALRSTA